MAELESSYEGASEIESLCMRCGENGITRFLITSIPHFREIVLMAFECPHCNERNNEVQFAGKLEPLGCRYTLQVSEGDREVLDRQVVKSDSATVKIPELELVIPPEAQRGVLSTVEGILLRAANDLQAMQEERWKSNPEVAKALDDFIEKLRKCSKGKQAFTLILDDPSGNSFIENNPDSPEQSILIEHYRRTSEQQADLGFLPQQEEEDAPENLQVKTTYVPAGTHQIPHGSVGALSAQRAIAEGNSEQVAAAIFRYSAPEEVMTFPSTCGTCGAKSETRMYVTNIPYFKEVIVMASTCDFCGYKNSELKPGGSVPGKAKKIIVNIINKADLCRDVIKSDTASVEIPELDVQLGAGTLGGLVTTVEGLALKIMENLKRVYGFHRGDSAQESERQKWIQLESNLQEFIELKRPWTLVLDDALANSFIAPATDAFEDDAQMKVEEYERSFEQNEELGLNDMDTSSADAAYQQS